ncbi:MULTISPECIES: DUF3040 domain-containing protein [unclassified Streptomyces]|uniref:DUF3040 domain-containing protein n=1 Tax=unclassified Streptomyces TaxID=2593676 RepID=UPI00035CD7B1|nr:MULTISPECIES: DUF3040 domain-containing protein [unclassified Streptomyces]ANH94170.1 hypothetical protein A8713_25790 [Streptomyces sp. SAT1]EYT83122.1 hypothetical protein CF54_09290 [Streptomyces sp. Tu 6176]MYR59052.1 DUF3040 domain-containing protein [Streptomyces sp. SID625]
MSTYRLPDHEQRILDEIERALSRDRRLARRLSATHRRRGPDPARVAAYAPRPVTVIALLAVAVALLAAGVATGEPGVIWAFAAVWPAALFAALRLWCHRARIR